MIDPAYALEATRPTAPQSQKNHQGRGNDQLTEQEAQEVLRILKDDSERCYNNYQTLMNQDETGEEIDPNRQGIARELARMNLNLNYYTQWYWKIDLHNLLHFLSLRADSHAQYEIRAYADVILDLVKKWVPHTYEAFMNYRVNGAFLSGMGLEVVKRLINGQKPNYEDMGMSKREWDELMQLLDRESLDQVA